MTREEAIKDLKTLKEFFEERSGAVPLSIEYAIKKLEQEPIEDAVSRQMVNELVDELARAISDERICISRGRSTATIMRDICHLPSVTPAQKTGHWIDVQGLFFCSECDDGFGDVFHWNYCPNCGAKMREVEE